MRRITAILCATALAGLLAAGCNSDKKTYSDAEYIMFADTLSTNMVFPDGAYFSIPVASTVACDYDRTFAVEAIDQGSNAIEGLHYDLESNNVTIKAGELTSSVKIRGHFDSFEDTDSIGVMLRLTASDDKIWDLYGRDTKVVLVKVCPFDINKFVGHAVLTSTFFAEYMPTTQLRLLKTELDPEVENGIILKDFLYDGYDIKVKFNTEKPLEPKLEMESDQVVCTTADAFQGNAFENSDNLVRAMHPQSVVSFYNVCQNFFLQYMTFYVNNVGVVGTYANVVELISEEEYNYLKKQGY